MEYDVSRQIGQRLQDYFETEEFKMRHVEQELKCIVGALNRLEKLGWELKDGEFTQSSADALPFATQDHKKMVVWYDVERNEWRSDTP